MKALVLLILVTASSFANAERVHATSGPELIMVELAGCEWCEVWDREIAPVLPKTPEGKCATLRLVDLHAPGSDILKHMKPVIYTPTFVVMEQGKEVGRVLGYAGEDFFWFLLGKELKKLKSGCKLPE